MMTENDKNSFIDIRQPPDHQWLDDEEIFDPKVHLALEEPERVWRLEEFGYLPEEVDTLPFGIAMTSPFRVLSSRGLEVLRDSVNRLQRYSRKSERIANYVRGGCYRSRFLRDLCTCPHLAEFMSRLAGKRVVPHTMPLYQGHINLLPEDRDIDVDKWHVDTVALDYVLLLTDPKTYVGGDFQFYPCKRERAIEAITHPREGDPQPISVDFPKAGYAILQQGNMIVHRACRVEEGNERTTLVQSFMPTSLDFKDISRLNDCRPVDPPEILFTEWARHKAWLSKNKLQSLIEHLPYTDDREVICAQLRQAIRDVQTAILEISEDAEQRMVYYGGDALTDPKS